MMTKKFYNFDSSDQHYPTVGATTLSITTYSIIKLSIKGLYVTLSITDDT
jgi:hypothetical protein